MGASYEKDIVAWASEQALLLRSGNLAALDIEHIAEEIEDVGKSEMRELASRMAILLSHLLKWQFQPVRRGSSWQHTIKEQRRALKLHILDVPSLQALLSNDVWFEAAWADALAKAIEETGIDNFPEGMPWRVEEVLSATFSPE